MPGIPTHFVILEKTIEKLGASPNPSLNAIANLMRKKDNSAYAYLGAIGPALGDFIPSDPAAKPGLPSGTQYLRIWQAIFGVVGGDGTSANPGLYSILKAINDFLDQVTAIVDAEDMDSLKAFQDQIDIINQTMSQLSTLVLSIPTVAISIASSICALRPAVDAPLGLPVPPPEVWDVRDFLHWKKTGPFVKALLKRAEDSGDDRFKAYAYGYVTSYAAKVCGSPFVNSIVLGPYRTQWWRHRWINNWVDAWIYGANGASASMAGDTPTPPYEAWPNLCDSNLQEKIGLPGIHPVDIMARLRPPQQSFPPVLPPEFAQFWVNAFSDAYGPPTPGSPIKAEALNGAYLMTWMVLWFQTSGAALGCNPAPPMAPPDNCGDTPSWSDPNVPGDNGSGQVPPAPEVETGVDVGKVVCGIILILLGAPSRYFGGAAAAAGQISGGLDLILNAGTVNWQKLRCDLYWYRIYLYNGLKVLHEILSLGGFAYPYANELANDQTVLSLLGAPFKYDSGQNLCKSRVRRNEFPAKPWDCKLGTWTLEPTAWEQPEQIAYETAQYPSFFVADPTNSLNKGEVRIGGTWPPGYRMVPGTDLPVQFGNAVDNAVDLLSNIGADFPSWNLDADRGLAFLTWQFTGNYTDPVAIEPEP
jgi:hypothetical protein